MIEILAGVALGVSLLSALVVGFALPLILRAVAAERVEWRRREETYLHALLARTGGEFVSMERLSKSAEVAASHSRYEANQKARYEADLRRTLEQMGVESTEVPPLLPEGVS